MITVRCLFTGGPLDGQFQHVELKNEKIPPRELIKISEGFHDPMLPGDTEVINYAYYLLAGDYEENPRRPGLFDASYTFTEYRQSPVRSVSELREE